MQTEPWNTSDEKANELTLLMFGTQDEVIKMAKMPRQAHNFTEVKDILNNIIGKPLVNKNGLTAYLSKNTAKEILSGKAVDSSFDRKAHLLAVANIDHLFTNTIEPWKFELNPNKNNENITAMRRLYSLMLYNDNLVVVKLTVKELRNKKEGNRIYSLKTIKVEIKKIWDAGNLAPGDTPKGSSDIPQLHPNSREALAL